MRKDSLAEKITLEADRGNSYCIPTETQITGWGSFPPDLALFIADFSDNRLTPIQQLIFFSYYFTGMTLSEIGERMHTSHQRIDQILKTIEEKIRHSWRYQDKWTDPVKEEYGLRSNR